eukprot:1040327-Rhodomonas_salina.2
MTEDEEEEEWREKFKQRAHDERVHRQGPYTLFEADIHKAHACRCALLLLKQCWISFRATGQGKGPVPLLSVGCQHWSSPPPVETLSLGEPSLPDKLACVSYVLARLRPRLLRLRSSS